jgi:NAD(P)H dehydrogenase (quinone)
MANLLVLFHSFYGHNFRLADAIAEGARSTGALGDVKQVPEHISDEALKASGALEAKKTFAHVPVAAPADLAGYGGIAFGTGTRFGNASSTMRNFLDQTGKLWNEGALIGKAATVFGATGTGGGSETTLVSMWFTLAHHGMVIVPLGYRDPKLRQPDEVHGASPYGVTTIARASTPRPSARERELAISQGRAWADVANRLARSPL